MSSSSIRFAPWVGHEYLKGFFGLRVLLVCESHYGDRKHERPTVTPEIVKSLALDERHPQATRKLRRHPHFTKIMNAVTGDRRPASASQKREFWAQVAYYNFLQEFIPDRRRLPPPAAWERGKSAFTEVLNVLAPELVICLSARTGRHLRPLAGTVPLAVVNHPSSHFAYSRVTPVIAEFVQRAQAIKEQQSEFISNEAFVRWRHATASAVPTPGRWLALPHAQALLAERQRLMAELDESRLAGVNDLVPKIISGEDCETQATLSLTPT